MKGIGDRTFEVIRQAVDGGVPDYLEGLRQRGQQPLATGGAELRSALRGDLHSHSDWSDGGSPIELMADAARTAGPRVPRPDGPLPQPQDRQRAQRRTPDANSSTSWPTSTRDGRDGFRLLTGIEVDILEDRRPWTSRPDMLDRLDIVVASVHSKLRSDRRTMTDRMLGRHQRSAHERARPLHRPPVAGVEGNAAAVRVRRRARVRGVRSEQRGRRNQFPPRTAGSAGRADPAGPRRRLPFQHRQRRPCPGPAGFPAVRGRARRPRTTCPRSGSSPPGRWTGCWNGPDAESSALAH